MDRTKSHIILLLTMLYGLFSHAAVDNGHQSLDGLLVQFDKSTKQHRVSLANEVMSMLLSKGFGDNIQFTDKTNPDSLSMNVWYYSAEYYLSLHQNSQCILYAQKALPLSEGNGDFTWHSECLNLLALAHFYQSDYYNALSFAEKMYQIDSKHEDYGRMCSTLNTIASIYLAANQPEQAKEYILRAIDADKKADDHSHQSAILGIAADIHQRLKQYRKALEYAQQAYETDKQNGSYKTAIRLTQMATANLGLGDTTQARRQLDEALPTLQEHQIMPSLGICHNDYGDLLRMGGVKNIEKARQHYEQAALLFQEKGELYNLLHSIHGLYLIYRETDPKMALTYIDQYTQLRDSIYRHEVQSLLCYYSTRFHQDELQGQIEAENKNSQSIYIGFIVGILILVTTIIILLILLSRSKKSVAVMDAAPSDSPQGDDTEDDTELYTEPEQEDPALSDNDRKFIGQLTNVVCSLANHGTVDINQVAEKLNLTPSQFRRKVSAITGMSPSSYMMQIRLSNAQRLLDKNPELSIGEVAFKCGFSDNSHFSHAFQKRFRISPTQYIRRAKRSNS